MGMMAESPQTSDDFLNLCLKRQVISSLMVMTGTDGGRRHPAVCNGTPGETCIQAGDDCTWEERKQCCTSTLCPGRVSVADAKRLTALVQIARSVEADGEESLG